MRRALVLGVVTVLVAGTACGGAGSSKAGGDPSPVTLRIGTDDEPGRPAAEVISDFARRVRALSGGQLVVEPVWKAAGRDVKDWDQAVARLLVGGELDLALVPARAWDTEGVASLRALQAPHLLTTSEAVGKVVTSDLAPELMSGLEAVGVTGLALVPEGLRYLFAFDEPVLRPTDLRGSVVRAPTSAATAALFAALGAGVDDLAGEAFRRRVGDGTVTAAESSFAFAGTLPAPSTVTGDLVLFPKVDALVAGRDVLAGLAPEQRQVLRRAAVATRDAAVRSVRSEAEAATRFCANGGTVVLAGEQRLAAFRRAAAPVHAQLRQDPATRRLLDRIQEVVAGGPAPVPVAPCAPTPVGLAAPSASGTTFPEGTYRAAMSGPALVAAGVDPGGAEAFDGVNDLRFRDGRWHHDTHGENAGDDCGGTYSVEAGRLVVWLAGCGNVVDGVLFSAGWSMDGSRLIFQEPRSEIDPQRFVDATWGGQPWKKID